MVRVLLSVAALSMLLGVQAAPATKAASSTPHPEVVETRTTPTAFVLTPAPTPAVAQTTPTTVVAHETTTTGARTTTSVVVTSAPTRRVESSVAPSSTTREPTAAPSSDAGVQAAAKEAARATSASSDALVTFEGVKSIAYQTAYYWIDVAKYCRDTAVTMLPKDMQAKYSQAVRDGNKYYAQAKDVYFAEVAPKIDPVIEASAAGAEEVYGFVNEKQKSVTAAPFKKMHAAYPATRGIAGSELVDRLVFIILSMTLLSWAVYLFKLPFRCLGYLLCPRRSKDVRSGAASPQSEKAKAQQGKGSPAAPTKNFKGKKQN